MEERPPNMASMRLKLFNSLRIGKVPIDDVVKALYTIKEAGLKTFFQTYHPLPHTLTDEKTLYV